MGTLAVGAVTTSGLLTTSNGQIAMPASQNASAGANVWDDYEEGTWTPVLAFGGASVGITYGTQAADYTKNGNGVILGETITLTAKGSSTGSATITGVPFTLSSLVSVGGAVGFYSSLTGLTGAPMTDINSTSLRLWQSAAAASTAITDAVFTATSILRIGGTYSL